MKKFTIMLTFLFMFILIPTTVHADKEIRSINLQRKLAYYNPDTKKTFELPTIIDVSAREKSSGSRYLNICVNVDNGSVIENESCLDINYESERIPVVITTSSSVFYFNFTQKFIQHFLDGNNASWNQITFSSTNALGDKDITVGIDTSKTYNFSPTLETTTFTLDPSKKYDSGLGLTDPLKESELALQNSHIVKLNRGNNSVEIKMNMGFYIYENLATKKRRLKYCLSINIDGETSDTKCSNVSSPDDTIYILLSKSMFKESGITFNLNQKIIDYFLSGYNNIYNNQITAKYNLLYKKHYIEIGVNSGITPDMSNAITTTNVNLEEILGESDLNPTDNWFIDDSSHIGDNFCEDTRVQISIRIIGYILLVAKLVVPIIIIAVGTLDLTKAVTGGHSDDLTKQMKALGIRIAIGVGVFMIPTLTNALLNLLQSYNVLSSQLNACQVCLLKPNECGAHVSEHDIPGNATASYKCSTFNDLETCNAYKDNINNDVCIWNTSTNKCVAKSSSNKTK